MLVSSKASVYVGLMCGCRHVCGVSVSVYVCVYRISVWVYMCAGLVCGIYMCVYIGLVYGYRYVYVGSLCGCSCRRLYVSVYMV